MEETKEPNENEKKQNLPKHVKFSFLFIFLPH